jgi:phosphoribosylanthranilate isomerase
MTRVKICGITKVDDALAAVAAGADALGFVFAESSRRVSPQAAREIRAALPTFVTTVGVFMNAPRDVLERAVLEAGVDIVQLHGDESPEYCARLSRRVMKRFAVMKDDTPECVAGRMAEYDVSAYVLDPGAGGGKTFDWRLAAMVRRPLVVAGGLRPENVGGAVRLLRPYAVDVSSGVESAPGRKDAARMRAFVQAVREADASDVAG